MTSEKTVKIVIDSINLEGNLSIPTNASGIVVFAHGSGSGRHSPRNRYVAKILHENGFATLLMDLLTMEEEVIDEQTAHLRFDISLLADRLVGATQWLAKNLETRDLRVGYFGASTGAAAALVGASKLDVAALVSRGGRPDLAGAALPKVRSPTLLIVGGNDFPVIEMNKTAMKQMNCQKDLVIVNGATHLFEEPGTLEEVARLAVNWFAKYLK